MKNWLALSFIYDFNPSLYNYINFKFYHFKFCSTDDSTVTASLYIDNLANEIKNEIAEQKSVNKKSLTLAVVKRISENKEAKQQMILLFEKKQIAFNKEEVKQFLNLINRLLNPSAEPKLIIQEHVAQSEQTNHPGQIVQPEQLARPEPITQPKQTNQPQPVAQLKPIAQSEQNTQTKQIADKEERIHSARLYARTYVIASHIYLEINNNESHYEELIQDLPALKKFISAKFKVPKIAGTIDDMRGYSYKTILSGRYNNIAKGQLKPLFNQIVRNPAIFGEDVSAFADEILKKILSF